MFSKRKSVIAICVTFVTLVFLKLTSKESKISIATNQEENIMTQKQCFTTSLTRENLFKYTKEKRCNRFIKLESEMGRLGNVMFATASLIGIAYDFDAIPLINENSALLKYFILPNVLNMITTNTATCSFMYERYNECENIQDKNITLKGYILSWKHFRNIKPLVKKIFQLKSPYLDRAKLFLSNISEPGYQNVCIQVRRGDYTVKYNKKVGKKMASKEYIQKAMDYYRQKYKNVKFIVLSDDIEWCRRNIENVAFSPFTDAGDDMALMTSCDHVIMTVGTFGWWGGWLSSGDTVYFENHFRNGSKLWRHFSASDYFPSDWIGF